MSCLRNTLKKEYPTRSGEGIRRASQRKPYLSKILPAIQAEFVLINLNFRFTVV
jgi:hypothetical protein